MNLSVLPIVRIKKLLDLAARGSKHEAEVALLRARELMDKHGLSPVDIQDAEIVTVLVEKQPTLAKTILARAVAQSRGCAAHISNDEGRVQIRGMAIYVRDAVKLYQTIVKRGEEGAVLRGNLPEIAKTVFAKVFWVELADAMRSRLKPLPFRGLPSRPIWVPGIEQPTSRKQVDLDSLFANELNKLVSDKTSMIEALSQRSLAVSPYEMAEMVDKLAKQDAGKICTEIKIGKPPKFKPKPEVRIRGLLVARPERISKRFENLDI